MPAMTQYTPELIERFYSKMSKTPTETGCLEWMSSQNDRGYGAFYFGKRKFLAHRVAWELINGPIPEGLLIRHMCNNRLCCNPAHLKPGTYAENTQDMMRSGRWKNAPNTRAPYVKPTKEERFYAKISTTPTDTGCLEWTAGTTKAGYGHINIGGKHVYAHRLAWELVNGPIPDGMCVCHRCDRPACCRIEHLFLGSMAENMHDREAKGRGNRRNSRGEKSHMAKLTESQVSEIRSDSKFAGWTQREIAQHFGISQQQVSRILNRKKWTHLDSSDDLPIRKTRLTEDEVLEMRSATYAGCTQHEIAKRFGISSAQVNHILHRKAWKHI